MNLQQFLNHGSHHEIIDKYPVISFIGGQQFPVLFFSLLFARFKAMGISIVESVDLNQSDFACLQAKFQTSFLGMHGLYWLKNIDDLDERQHKQWTLFLQEYQGPNTLAYFSTTLGITKSSLEIKLLDFIDQGNFALLMKFFGKNVSPQTELSIRKIYRGSDTLTLDAACLLMHYIQLLGSNIDYFVDHWLDKIIAPERSLFTLSSMLFSKKAKLFHEQWKLISKNYADVFWIAFWTEQLWRAYHFVEFSKLQNYTQAKKIGVRLPFTFLQRDWQQFSPNELKNAHQALYELDYALKNGGSSIGLDVFYSKFFLHAFK